jgi:ATP-binding cassette subfamily F protein 3
MKEMDDIDEIGKFGLSLDECENRDAYATVWKDMVANNETWGGRAHGGRGVRKVNGKPLSISLDQVNISFDGREILENASLKFNINHRYGLLGSNGVGKTTLLRRIVRGSIPGFPQYFTCHYVQQETSAFTDSTVYEFIMTTDSDDESKERRLAILKQEEIEYEEMLTNADSVNDIEEITTRLCEICEEIEMLSLSSDDQSQSTSLDLDNVTEKLLHEKLPPKVLQILKGLGLSSLKYLKRNLSSLSGGYRVRCFLAKALSSIKENAVVLLDECTNHLDIPCIEWLEDYLVNHLPPAIVILVSHDHQFLENTCTDIIEMKNRAN